MRGFANNVVNFVTDEDGARVIALAAGVALVFMAFSHNPAVASERLRLKDAAIEQAKAEAKQLADQFLGDDAI